MESLKDTGNRREFESGAVRDRGAGKPMLKLIPPWALYAYGWIMESGAQKYAERNWEKGMPISEYIDSAERHLQAYKMGLRDEPHLWQALWNIGCAVHTQILVYLGVYPPSFYNLPNHVDNALQLPIMSKFEMERVDKVVGPRAMTDVKDIPHVPRTGPEVPMKENTTWSAQLGCAYPHGLRDKEKK